MLFSSYGRKSIKQMLNHSVISPYDVEKLEESAVPSLILLFMAISYGIVVIGGIIGNTTLVLTLCSASAVRLRNPLLLAVCLADLLVTGVSAPISILNLVVGRDTKSQPWIQCKFIHYIQVMPVAASTISFFMLSLDRYATVKHPRLAQLRKRPYLHVSLAVISWITSAVISTPFLFAYNITVAPIKIDNTIGNIKNIDINHHTLHGISSNTNKSLSSIKMGFLDGDLLTLNPEKACSIDLNKKTIFVSFIIFHTIAVFILPGIGVLLNHYGVRKKLCALSLTARAAHGELPLPMPILRRQTHIVVVAGITNVRQTADSREEITNCDAIPIRKQRSVKSSNPISPRAMREIRAHSQRQRIGIHFTERGPITPGIPLPQTSTLRSRRHLANMLIASALLFILCWAPHVVCIFYKNLGYKQYCTNTSTYFNLLLGYMYSAVSPVIYWALNHNTLKQSPCAPIMRLRSMQNFLRKRFRSHAVPPPPSSTNEAALGAFNPKLIKLTPKEYRAHASSHYLY